MSQHAALADVIRTPEKFARAILGHDPWWTAVDIMHSVMNNARTVVKSCHASSKTFTAAEIATWWPVRFSDGRVVTTAPTDTQVKELLWKEIGLNVEALREKVGGIPSANQKSWRLSAGRDAVGLSTNQGVRFQGWHGDHILIILDEAAGVRPDIFPAIEGIRAGGGVHVLAIGNPASPSGPFYDAFTKDRALWTGFTINALKTPNFVDETYTGPGRRFLGFVDPNGARSEKCCACERKDVAVDPQTGACDACNPVIVLRGLRNSDRLQYARRKYLVLREWVLEKYDEWGFGSPLWDTKVLGEFPAEGADQLLGLSYLNQAESREIPDTDDTVQVGIDVAGPGEDETVLTVRRGPNTEHMRGWAMPDPRGACLAELEPWRDELMANGLINVDSVGMGYYFGKHLQDVYGNRVRFVNVGLDSRRPETYLNLKAELYWGLRMRVRKGDISFAKLVASDNVTQSTIDKTISQLASIKYDHNPRGQIFIEPKKDAVKRGVKSPDYAESIMLAYAQDTAPGMVQFMEQMAAASAAKQAAKEGEDDDDD